MEEKDFSGIKSETSTEMNEENNFKTDENRTEDNTSPKIQNINTNDDRKEQEETSDNIKETKEEVEYVSLLKTIPIMGENLGVDNFEENVFNLVEDENKIDVACQTELYQDDEIKDDSISYDTNNIKGISSSEESSRESEEVELRKKKRLNITVALRNSFNGKSKILRNSFRSKKCKSESSDCDGKTLNKKIKEFASGMTALLQYQKALTISPEQPPAPLLVEDPPTDNEGEEGELKSPKPALFNGSSGNFGSSATSNGGGLQQSNAGGAAARSAPSTPQGLLVTPPGAALPSDSSSPSPAAIQKSPSHAVFSKVDKTNLKHLSTSTPVMTAQGQLTEPPSPKAVKDPKVHTTSKARQKKFLRHFPNVEEEEKVLNHYSCALIGDILLQGHLYITKNYFAFYSNVFGYVTKLLIPILTVEDITKEKTARIIPNAVGVLTLDDKHIFGSLMSRDSTLAYMRTVWQKAKSEEIIPEPDIVEPEDQDSSESCESGRESPIAEIDVSDSPLSTPKFALMKTLSKEVARNSSDQGSAQERKGSKGFIHTLKDAIAEFRKLPRQNLILVATTLLLVLLFLSAAVLLYRINRIQNRFSLSFQEGGLTNNNGGDIYSNLLRWQAQLHSKSADAVNNLLDSNLDQISKVRQSLEALSMLLIQTEDGNESSTVETRAEQIAVPPPHEKS